MDLTIGYFMTSLYGISSAIRYCIDIRTGTPYKTRSYLFYFFGLLASLGLILCGWFLGMSTGYNPIFERQLVLSGIRTSFLIFAIAGVIKEISYWLDRFVIK